MRSNYICSSLSCRTLHAYFRHPIIPPPARVYIVDMWCERGIEHYALVVPQLFTLHTYKLLCCGSRGRQGWGGRGGVRLIPVLISGDALPWCLALRSTREDKGRDLPCYVSEIAGIERPQHPFTTRYLNHNTMYD